MFPSHQQVSAVADSVGLVVWLMRGCGLRIEEALAVHRDSFESVHAALRGRCPGTGGRRCRSSTVRPESTGTSRCLAGWLWEKVSDLPDGPLIPGNNDRTYQIYNTVWAAFKSAAKDAGVVRGFRPHSLRHAFASTLLSRSVPITDVARWLGHRDINETYRTYSHFMPEAEDRAVSTLDAEYAEWSRRLAA